MKDTRIGNGGFSPDLNRKKANLVSASTGGLVAAIHPLGMDGNQNLFSRRRVTATVSDAAMAAVQQGKRSRAVLEIGARKTTIVTFRRESASGKSINQPGNVVGWRSAQPWETIPNSPGRLSVGPAARLRGVSPQLTAFVFPGADRDGERRRGGLRFCW
jgi:hypothetical protein